MIRELAVIHCDGDIWSNFSLLCPSFNLIVAPPKLISSILAPPGMSEIGNSQNFYCSWILTWAMLVQVDSWIHVHSLVRNTLPWPTGMTSAVDPGKTLGGNKGSCPKADWRSFTAGSRARTKPFLGKFNSSMSSFDIPTKAPRETNSLSTSAWTTKLARSFSTHHSLKTNWDPDLVDFTPSVSPTEIWLHGQGEDGRA